MLPYSLNRNADIGDKRNISVICDGIGQFGQMIHYIFLHRCHTLFLDDVLQELMQCLFFIVIREGIDGCLIQLLHHELDKDLPLFIFFAFQLNSNTPAPFDGQRIIIQSGFQCIQIYRYRCFG